MNYSIGSRLAILLLMFICLPVFASEVRPLQDLVRRSFADNPIGPGFFMKNKSGVHVEVCGDSCTYFDWNGNVNDERFWRFIVLFELNDDPGTDVKLFVQNVKAMKSLDIIEKNFCSIKGDDIFTINCDWKSYARRLKITVGHSKYDEGERCYAEGIGREPGEWDKLKWKCSPMNPKESPFQ